MVFYHIGEYFEDKAVSAAAAILWTRWICGPRWSTWSVTANSGTFPPGTPCPATWLLVRPGDRIPLDGVVTEGESLLDTSAITGEPVPVTVRPGDNVTSGCVNQNGLLTLRVEKPLSESMVTRILDSVENAAASKPHIDRFITRFCRVYTPFVVVLAALTALIPPPDHRQLVVLGQDRP